MYNKRVGTKITNRKTSLKLMIKWFCWLDSDGFSHSCCFFVEHSLTPWNFHWYFIFISVNTLYHLKSGNLADSSFWFSHRLLFVRSLQKNFFIQLFKHMQPNRMMSIYWYLSLISKIKCVIIDLIINRKHYPKHITIDFVIRWR